MDAIPDVKNKKVTSKEVDQRIEQMASQQAPFVDIKEDRGLQNDDQAVFDFEGFIDNKPFEGGKADNFNLIIGSGQFIPGFEEQMIGLRAGQETTISVKFPDDYQAEELKGKDSKFKIKLHSIQTREKVDIDDELAKKLLPNDKNATLDKLKEQIKEQIKNEKMSRYYQDELKPVLIDKLLNKYDFDLPKTIVEAEIDNALNNKAKDMDPKQLQELKDNPSKIQELREELREEAVKSVKLTFIVDALAAKEGINVADSEVEHVLRYEAMMYGQDGDALLKQYEDQGLLPVIKMSMIEDRLVTHLLDTKLKAK
jgi:trigger factor